MDFGEELTPQIPTASIGLFQLQLTLQGNRISAIVFQENSAKFRGFSSSPSHMKVFRACEKKWRSDDSSLNPQSTVTVWKQLWIEKEYTVQAKEKLLAKYSQHHVPI